jgi:hypothetical protein
MKLGANFVNNLFGALAIRLILAKQVELTNGQITGRRWFTAHATQLAIKKFVGQLG